MHRRRVLPPLLLAACAGSGGGSGETGTSEAGGEASGTSSTTSGSGSSTSGTSSSTSGGGTTSGTSSDGGSTESGATTSSGSDTGGEPGCDWGDGSCAEGTVLFCEPFDDGDLMARGWYDGPAGTIDPEAYEGSGAFRCDFALGETGCAAGRPGRHPVAGTESVYLGYRVRYSDGWVGSQRPYHPHEFHFVTDLDDDYVGPAGTHLTLYVEQVGGTPRLAIQDALNVDTTCILRNDDSFVGCGGSFADYVFTEARSVSACNGLLGHVDGRDCFDNGGGQWYSARFWDADLQVFADAAPHDKSEWHRVEAYFQLNTIVDGIGQVDGQIRYWFDGELLIASDEILLRTGEHPDMLFDQFLIAPYIGDGSPIDQTMWIDDLRVATAPTNAPCP